MFCQVGRGYGGRGGVTLGGRGKGNVQDVCLVCFHYFGVCSLPGECLGVDIR